MVESGQEKIVVNRYKLLEKIGDGGMGNIYLAKDLQISRQVAVKTIRSELKENPEVYKRINRECNLHATLGVHPNIVALHDRIDQDGDIYLIMEYVKGETLTARMKKNQDGGKAFSTEEIVTVVCQTLDALTHIHKNDILHRDIKPSNIILVDKDDNSLTAKLMDFGIAAQDSEDPEATKLTTLVTGGPGTPAYMAPERIDAETFGESGPATDLYSVGVILYELLGGCPPFQGTMTEVLTGHLAKVPKLTALPESIPSNLLSVLKKSLEKKQQDRYQDAAEFARDLRQTLIPGQGETSHTETARDISLDQTLLATDEHQEAINNAVALAKKANSKSGKRLWPLLVLLFVCLAGVGIGGYFYLQQSETSPGTNEVTLQQPEGNATSKENEGQPPSLSSIDGIEKTDQIENVKVFKMEPIEPVVSLPDSNEDQPAQSTSYDPSKTDYKVPNNKKGKGGDALEAFNLKRASQNKTPDSSNTPVAKVQSPPVVSPNVTKKKSSASSNPWANVKIIVDETSKKQ